MSDSTKATRQCQRPSGWIGRIFLGVMNRRHSGVTDWGLSHVRIDRHDVILDVGCGGGQTVHKLAAVATEGKVYGIDYAAESVAVSRRKNRSWIESGRVAIQQASVSDLPFSDDTFDLVTAVETHFWWANLPGDLREVLRVVKPGGRLAVIAEFYNGGKHARYAERLARATTMALLTVDQHRDMLVTAGFADVDVIEDAAKGWIVALGEKPL